MANRFWCGECNYKTPWAARPEGLRRQIEHYARKHPGISPAGHIETRRRAPGRRNGCLLLAAGALVLLTVVAAWRH
ncbi:hypothetical protein KPP03845_107428 [Streptomyces xanthophaeus]|uniref:hypothetical protein n=1 Tax=Streptomyces xanthophaeus TaxID=67385 RepID=UPI00233F1E08|nr:hypothetical protein [Streptomyces xanthophaeus]WCD90999.1 hypothetical protein KPP03845_107428 [Streptomyces xanthophaeus]